MSRPLNWLFAVALLPVAACSSNSITPSTAAPVQPPLAAADQAFINGVAGIDAAEIQAGQLAMAKGRSPRVKAYATKIVSDHQAVDQQLMTLAQSKGVTPDATQPQMMTDTTAKLSADRPALFDRDFARQQVQVNQAAVKAFQDEIANGQDADLKQFATSTLPTLQQHLAASRRLGGR